MKEYWTCPHCKNNIFLTIKNEYIAKHVKACSKLKFHDFIEKYYLDESIDFINGEKCAFCDKESTKIIYNIDHRLKKFNKKYHQYFCDSEECKIETFNKIWPTKKYSKHLWSKIGGAPEFLSKVYSIPIEDAKKMKIGKSLQDPNFDWTGKTTSLSDYIIRYGKEDGTKKYEERNKKISRSNTKEYYLSTYGDIIGNNKWNSYISKLKEKNHGITRSKISDKFLSMIKEIYNDDIEFEYLVSGKQAYRLDGYLPKDNIVIEFYGDYWHANPKDEKFKDPEYYHKSLHCKVKEKWIKDENKINDIYEVLNKPSIFIIWESSFYKLSMEELKKYLKLLIDNKGLRLKI